MEQWGGGGRRRVEKWSSEEGGGKSGVVRTAETRVMYSGAVRGRRREL